MIDAIDTEAQNLQRMWDRFSDASASGVSGAKTEQSAKKVVKEVTTLLASDSNMRVKTANAGQTEPGQVAGRTGVPELDEPASRTNMNQNLEKLLLYLQLDNDERQVELAETRLLTEKDAIAKKHEQEAQQIKQNIAAQDAMAKKQKIMKILGWAMIGVAVAAAIVTGGVAIAAMGAATAAAAAAAGGTAAGVAAGASTGVATGTAVGATTGATVGAEVASSMMVAAQQSVTTAIQVGVGATLSTAFMTLNETGVAEKATEGVKDLFKSMGLDERQAMIAAGVSVAVFQLSATLGASFGAGAAANAAQGLTSLSTQIGKTAFDAMAKVGKEALAGSSKFVGKMTSSSLTFAMKLGTAALSATGVVGQAISTKAAFESAMAQSETTELNAVLQKLQQMMDETNEELNLLLTQVQNIFGTMAGIIDSSMETEKEIAQNLGNMA